MRVAALLMMFIAVSSTSNADPVGVLDYKFDPPALAFGVVTIQSFGGPFAVSMSTPVRQSGHLARFELPLSVSEFFPRPEADITFWVLPMVNEFPSDDFSDALATGVIDASKLPVLQEASTPLFTSVTLAERPAVTAGQRIALVVQSDPTGTFMWSMASGNLFPEGDPYGRRLCDSSTGAECPWVKGISEGDDYGFRTYVEPDVAPVPEPGSV